MRFNVLQEWLLRLKRSEREAEHKEKAMVIVKPSL